MSILSRFKGLIEENLPRDGSQLGLWLESQNPEVAKRFLGYASDLLEPHHLGMGLRVKEWGDEAIQLFCPLRWVNRHREGRFHWGVVVSAGELALQLFWQRHLGVAQDQISVQGVQTQVNQELDADLTLHYDLNSLNREQILFHSREPQGHKFEAEVGLFDANNIRRGSLNYNLHIQTKAVLEGGSTNS